MVEFLRNLEQKKGKYMQYKIHELHRRHGSFRDVIIFPD